MPLKARISGRAVHSFDLPRELSWSRVQQASRMGEISMVCCGAPGVAKQLASGTRFFAHKASAVSCDWESETAEHLRLKALACEAALAAGAAADTEVRSERASDGTVRWIADVMVMHGDQRRVIEIQLSPQTLADTRHRTQRYQEDGLDVLWLFRRLPEGMEIGEQVPAIVLPDDQAEAERRVRLAAAAFATGKLVWDEGTRTAPFTLAGYDIQCSNCGEKYHHTPWALLRRGETDGRFSTIAVETRDLSVRGISPWRVLRQTTAAKEESPDPLGRRFGSHGSSCPHCRASGPKSPLTIADVLCWPYNQVDGTANWSLPAMWRPTPLDPVPHEPTGAANEWNQILQHHALAIDPCREEIFFRARRADFDERDRMHREAEEARRKKLWEEDQAKWKRIDQLSVDLKGNELTRVRVNVSVSDTTINSITIRSPYDAASIHALKELRGEWNPKDKVWKVSIGWGEFSKAQRVLSVVRSMRSRLDR